MRRSAATLRRLHGACVDAHAERRALSASAGPREEVRAASLPFIVCSHSIGLARTLQVVIALGSNQGDRAELLRAAARALRPAGVDVTAFSSLYETAPAYVTDQARSRAPGRDSLRAH